MRKSYYFEVGNFANTGRIFICDTPEAVECVKAFTDAEKVTKAHAMYKLKGDAMTESFVKKVYVDSRILDAKDKEKALYHFEDND